MNKKLIITLFMFAFTTQAQAQNVIRGSIKEKKTDVPIPYVNISLSNTSGTASDEHGNFIFSVDSTSSSSFKVSSLGYYSQKIDIDSLLRISHDNLIIYLDPFITTLTEVTVAEKKLSAEELVRQAIDAISQNYRQSPFNMEFYSQISAGDSSKAAYLVETIVESYREGYKEGGQNFSHISQRRVTGENPLPAYDKKRKMTYFSYELNPHFDMSLADMIGSGSKFNYTIFNPKFFNKLEFRQENVTLFEGDTVAVVAYDPKNFRSEEEKGVGGKLYISTRTLAILKHERRIGSTRYDAIYRKYGETYYPYFIKSVYYAGKTTITSKAVIVKITTENLKVINVHSEGKANWHLDDVPYDEKFWMSFDTRR